MTTLYSPSTEAIQAGLAAWAQNDEQNDRMRAIEHTLRYEFKVFSEENAQTLTICPLGDLATFILSVSLALATLMFVSTLIFYLHKRARR